MMGRTFFWSQLNVAEDLDNATAAQIAKQYDPSGRRTLCTLPLLVHSFSLIYF
jgi:hypothetical protein